MNLFLALLNAVFSELIFFDIHAYMISIGGISFISATFALKCRHRSHAFRGVCRYNVYEPEQKYILRDVDAK